MKNDYNDAIFRANAADAGKITLHEILWYMPHVMPVVREKMELYKIIEKKEKIPVGYRMIQCDSNLVNKATSFTWILGIKSSPEVPRFIIVGFQTNKSGNQRQNPPTFNHVSVKHIYTKLNSMRYPAADYNISFLHSNLVESMVMQR